MVIIHCPIASNMDKSVYFIWHRFKPFPNKPLYLHICSTTLSKRLWEKDKFIITSNFPFFPCSVLRFGELFTISIKFKIVTCKLFKFGRDSKICCLGKD